jgi:flagellar biosynthesis/type III secretory pathway protein FliH
MLSDLEIHCVPCDGIAPGDLRIELRSGTIDLSLAARLEAALSAWPR